MLKIGADAALWMPNDWAIAMIAATASSMIKDWAIARNTDTTSGMTKVASGAILGAQFHGRHPG